MADHLAAPTPLEEHRKLAAFAGEWAGEEMVYPSRWTAGGPAAGSRPDGRARSTRAVHIGPRGALPHPVYERSARDEGTALEGPAVVEQDDSTVLVEEGWHAAVGAAESLVLARSPT